MGFLIFFPFIVAIAGILIGLLILLAGCLLLMGISGTIMRKIYASQVPQQQLTTQGLYNVGAISLGIVLALLPIGYVLYTVMVGIFGK